MNMVKCSQCNKFYNADVDAVCPHCGGTGNASLEAARPTEPVNLSAAGKTEPVQARSGSYQSDNDSDKGRTKAVVHEKLGIDPVVGWLTAINGSEKGRDYRIHSDNNYLGRSDKMDIVIKGDETISRENHANITYDDREKVFYVTPGDGRSIVRLNGKALLMTSELKAYDKIEVGMTKLVFIPLCGEQFDWESEDEEE